MKTCPRCGVENKPEKAACWNCWSPLESPAGGAPQPKASGRRVSLAVPWTAVIVVLLVFAAAVGAYLVLFSSKPGDVAEQYLEALRNGNDQKRDRLATKDTAGENPMPKIMLISKFQVQRDAVTVTGNTAEVPATINFIVEPAIGLVQPVAADAVTSYLQRQPVRGDLVLAKERFQWRVDQTQTKQRFQQALLRGLPPGLGAQVAKLMVAPPPAPVPAPSAPGAAPATAPGVTPGARAAPKFGLGGRPQPGGAPAASPGAAKAKAKAPSAQDEEETGTKGGLKRALPSDTGD
jgi:flagellar basal body-associated protein FliL